jgi:hypothetical protein
MCKIDYLKTGICPSAKNGNYVSYYPQGRMDLYKALAAKAIPITPLLFDIADTCTLCGNCDKQCYFVTGLRPVIVMRALKKFVAEYRAAKRPVDMIPSNPILDEFKKALGDEWVSNDPAILVGYADDPCPLATPVLPHYVVVPKTREDIQTIVHICNAHKLPYAVRGNGSSVMGFVMSSGVVIDTNRMRDSTFDTANWCVIVGPGVTAFDLQHEAQKLGYRVNVAEPAAMVAANIMCSGIFSLFSASYGISADNYICAEFVGPDGEIFSLNDKSAPNLFSYRKKETPPPGICTSVSVKLHPLVPDEEGILVPFPDFEKAAGFARELSQRRIGTGIGVLGGEYVSVFMSPTNDLAFKVKAVITEKLGIRYLVLVIGDKYAMRAIRSMGVTVLDNKLFRMLMLAFPKLAGSAWIDMLDEMAGNGSPYELLGKAEIQPLIEAALAPSPEVLAGAVDADMREFFTTLYERPEMTDLVWLNMFRILSSRMGRDKHVLAIILYVPMNDPPLIEEISGGFTAIGARHGIRGDYGFVTPLDEGKRAVFEYDYYIDHTSKEDRAKVFEAIPEIAGMIEGYSAKVPAVKWIKYTLHQGFCRSEALLYT